MGNGWLASVDCGGGEDWICGVGGNGRGHGLCWDEDFPRREGGELLLWLRPIGPVGMISTCVILLLCSTVLAKRSRCRCVGDMPFDHCRGTRVITPIAIATYRGVVQQDGGPAEVMGTERLFFRASQTPTAL